MFCLELCVTLYYSFELQLNSVVSTTNNKNLIVVIPSFQRCLAVLSHKQHPREPLDGGQESCTGVQKWLLKAKWQYFLQVKSRRHAWLPLAAAGGGPVCAQPPRSCSLFCFSSARASLRALCAGHAPPGEGHAPNQVSHTEIVGKWEAR